jgi:hypothetical protein
VTLSVDNYSSCDNWWIALRNRVVHHRPAAGRYGIRKASRLSSTLGARLARPYPAVKCILLPHANRQGRFE